MQNLQCLFRETDLFRHTKKNLPRILIKVDERADNKVDIDIKNIADKIKWDDIKMEGELLASGFTYVWYEYSHRELFLRIAVEFNERGDKFCKSSVRIGINGHPDLCLDSGSVERFGYSVDNDGTIHNDY